MTNIEELESKLKTQRCFILQCEFNTKLKWELLYRKFSYYTVYDKYEVERYVIAWYTGKRFAKYENFTELLGVPVIVIDAEIKTFKQLCKKYFDFFDEPYRLSDKKNLPHRLYGFGMYQKWSILNEEQKLGHRLHF